MLNQTFSLEKICNKSHQVSVLRCLPIEKFKVLLECVLLYAHPIFYPKCIGSGIQTTVKPNELSSVMTLCRHGFRNCAMAYMLQSRESTIHRIFVAWVVFVKAIFSCLNLKLDNGFLYYSMPEVFNKTGHGVTDMIAWDELRPVMNWLLEYLDWLK